MTHYLEIKAQVKPSIRIVAVSKLRSIADIEEAYRHGCRDFGENRVQALLEKISLCSSDIRWHMIGSLQKNKVKDLVGKIELIHSVDTPELAEKISLESQKKGLITNVLLQVNTSKEAAKHGLSVEEWRKKIPEVISLPGLHVQGLMTMAPLTEDTRVIRKTFRDLRLFAEELKLPLLSMGMSHDYKIAIEEGANILRIGTAIFEK